ncbi:acylphosphatase [Proteinivorax hydrogeniformans]|uniref:Acylphosphatase n=1 Tax=Proteinivorax hydrogeniformans TaxID=1826727 RepID=A0AAU8HX12_9FIRM
MKTKLAKRRIKMQLYKALCILLHPKEYELTPYQSSPIKRRITTIIANDKSAVYLHIKGDLSKAGYRSWLRRKARSKELSCYDKINQNKNVEAVLVGKASEIEEVARLAWAGPINAKVENVKTLWFNKPSITAETNDDQNVDQVAWSQETANLIKETLNHLNSKSDILQKTNKFKEKNFFNSSVDVKRVADDKNLFVTSFSRSNYIVSPREVVGFQQAITSEISNITDTFTNHKHLVKEFLTAHSLHAPEGDCFTELHLAKNYFKSCNHPIVVKPADGRQGRGITVDVRSETELEVAWNFAKKYHNQIILEELVLGVDLRVYVIGGKASTVLLRIPANIVGDGTKTVQQLIEAKNKKRLQNPHLAKKLIIPDTSSLQFLKRQGHTMNSIPQKDEVVFLHLKANLGAGGDSIAITNYTHPDLKRLAEQAAKAVGLQDYCGIDLLVESIDEPRLNQKCSIVEVNSKANIFMVRFPMYGKPTDTTQEFMDYMFNEDKYDNSYPKDKKKIQLTGLLDNNIVQLIKSFAKDLNLNGRISYAEKKAEIIAEGRRHHILMFLDKLWNLTKTHLGSVDGLLVEKHEGDLPQESGFEVLYDSTLGVNHIEKSNSFSNIKLPVTRYNPKVIKKNLDIQLFVEEFRDLGYCAEHAYEDLIKVTKDGKTGITGIRHSSIFSDQACEKKYMSKKLMAFNNIPVPRGAIIKAKHLKKALNFYKNFPQNCTVTELKPHSFYLESNSLVKHVVKGKKSLKSVWKKALKRGVNNLLIEEKIDGFDINIAVVDGQFICAQIIAPVKLHGDGKSTVSELIDEIDTFRSKNPFYESKLIAQNDAVMQQLRDSELNLEDIPKQGESIVLKGVFETVDITDTLHDDFKKKATDAVNSIPGLLFAAVNMTIPKPDNPINMQKWIVNAIDTNPSVAQFHFPWKGKPVNLAKIIIQRLCLAGKIYWIGE